MFKSRLKLFRSIIITTTSTIRYYYISDNVNWKTLINFIQRFQLKSTTVSHDHR